MNEKFRQLAEKYRWKLSAAGFAVVIAGVLVLASHSGKAKDVSDDTTIPSVAVVKAVREDLSRDIRIPAEFRPYAEVELHAKVSGYLQAINVDFGDHVKAGQILATIEIPELQDDLNSAIATQEKAEADHKNAHLVYTRLEAVNKEHPNLVAQQDLDAAESRDADTAAAVSAAKSEVGKYHTLLAYTKITAPFDGVITRRFTDPGSMIQAGTTSQAMPIVRLSDNYRLRLDFPVSVDYVKDLRVGDPVDVRVDSLAGKLFTGQISRYTQRVDETTRTMIAEMDVTNQTLELIPGMYAVVILKVERRSNVLVIPVEAVTPGKSSIYVVGPDGAVEERVVTLGLETPTQYEALSGVKEGDLVLVGHSSQINPGEKVKPKIVNLVAAQ